ncbi:hypothetical protein [Streptacidiphilus cavernicola]|uniref:PH domain-containing protein n=1 Tax=Streptacidiphilus cavernicola TaxID=3342716 RepID=A0ABV6W4P1_9ACTN
MSTTAAHCSEQPPLELRPARFRRLAPLTALLVLVQLSAVARLFDPADTWTFGAAVVACAADLLALLLIAVTQWRLRSKAWLLRLDQHGVTVHGHRTVPWADLLHVKSTLPRKGRPVEVVFLARPGILLPPMPSGLPLPFSRPAARAAALTRRFGSPLVLLPTALSASAPEILAVVQRLSDLPTI